jgi:hypothetical protein
MQRTEEEYKIALINTGLALGVFSGLGFEFANQSNLYSKLKKIKPEGSTAMRDAIMKATSVMLDLYRVISSLGGGDVWNFVHIVLTDGDDNASKTSLDDACAVMYSIGLTLKVSTLKTYLIGVDLSNNSSINNITVNRNSEKIDGVEENFTIDVNNGSVEFIYTNTTYGWRTI